MNDRLHMPSLDRPGQLPAAIRERVRAIRRSRRRRRIAGASALALATMGALGIRAILPASRQNEPEGLRPSVQIRNPRPTLVQMRNADPMLDQPVFHLPRRHAPERSLRLRTPGAIERLLRDGI